MNTKNILLLVVAFFTMNVMIAQNEIDALRFSRTEWSGTARFIGAGGAFGAVGADFSALSTNPASIGLFKKTEISITPLNFSILRSESTYNDELTPTTKVKNSFSNLGIVFAWDGATGSKWKKGQFAIGFNQIMNFSNNFAVEGRSNGSSMGQAFAEAGSGFLYDELPLEQLFAYQAYIIDPVNNSANNTEYVSPLVGKDLLQKTTVNTTGKINELAFSFGGNYDDKFFAGATLGVPFLTYTETRKYEESDDNNLIDHLTSFYINDKLMVNSTGVNLKIGVLYQPVSFLRIGAAFHTPTLYSNVHDILEREMVSMGDTTLNVSYTNDYNYQLITPMRVMANVAFLIMKRGFISADYEYTDYSKSEMGAYGANTYLFKDENKAIRDSYKGTHSIRIGGELYVTKNVLLRGGYSYTSSPYQNNINDASLQTCSFGLGFRGTTFFADLAYQLKASQQNYWFFNHEMVNPVNQYFLSHSIVGTIGWKL
ncbi:MAG: hypothetical protein CVU02_01475 [Bacteroidetes bacterium HGW-Bacteroidetes-19]|nr:MAG: hypothetical protein CVU02_01475 [Bacteroidetes bacterium HGW-Bacteroidetes-19]